MSIDNMEASMLVFVFALAVCMASMPVAIVVAAKLGLTDQPSGRKRHQVSTPLVGGICIFFAFAVAKSVFPMPEISWTLLAWFLLVLAVGVIDDLVAMSPKHRLLIHALVVVGIFFTDGLAVTSVGALLGAADITFNTSLAIVLVTIIGVVGAINTVNMMDGADGLLGSIFLASLLAILMLVYRDVDVTHIVAMLGACSAFVLLNSRFLGLKRGLLFLGDAGSTALGFFIVYLVISYSQGDAALFSPVVAGWIIGLPLLDASAVIFNRLLEKKSPFAAGRDHIHHLLMDKGLSVNQTVLYMLGAHSAMLLIALYASQFQGSVTDAYLFWGFVMLVICRICFAPIMAVKLAKRRFVSVAEMVGTDSLVEASADQVKIRSEKKKKVVAGNWAD